MILRGNFCIACNNVLGILIYARFYRVKLKSNEKAREEGEKEESNYYHKYANVKNIIRFVDRVSMHIRDVRDNGM